MKVVASRPRYGHGWAEHGLCSGKTELFFEPPGEREGRRKRREATARSYCAACPVSDQCRVYGREHRENGMWGGENDEQRALAGYAPQTIFRRSVAAARRKGLESLAGDPQSQAVGFEHLRHALKDETEAVDGSTSHSHG